MSARSKSTFVLFRLTSQDPDPSRAWTYFAAGFATHGVLPAHAQGMADASRLRAVAASIDL